MPPLALISATPFFPWLLRSSWQAAVLAALVLLAQWALKSHLSPRWRHNLWLIVLLRLCLPALPATPFSIFNLFPSLPSHPQPTQLSQPAPLIAAPADVSLVRQPPSFATPSPDTLAVSRTHPADSPTTLQDLTSDHSSSPDPLASIQAQGFIPGSPQLTIDNCQLSIVNSAPITSLRPPTSPTRASPLRTGNPLATALLFLWLLIASLLTLRTLIASLRLSAHVKRLAPITDPTLCTLLHACQREMGLRRPITLLAAPQIPTPALLGFLHPRLLLPTHLLPLHALPSSPPPSPIRRFADSPIHPPHPSPLTPDPRLSPHELRLIFLHELAHVRRHDVALNWLTTLLQILHWFNPILHLAFARLRADRELACDELVLHVAHRHERHAYGQTILKLLQNISRRPALPGMVGILEGSHLMRRRITMIARFKDSPSRWSLLAVIALLALSAVALTDAVNGQTPQPLTQAQPATPAPLALASPATAPSSTPVDPATSNPPVDNRLDISSTGTVEINVTDAALSEILRMLALQSGGNIIADWQALKAIGINERTTVSFYAKDVTVPDALRLIARQLGRNVVCQPEGKTLVLTVTQTPPVAANPPAATPSPDITPIAPSPAQPAQPVKTRFASSAPNPANDRLLIALNKPVEKVNLTDVPLREAVDHLRQASGVNLVADWKALDSAGVAPDTNITVAVADVPLKEVLRLILRAAGDNLTYDIEGGVLTITTTEEADRQLLIKVYDISNLVDAPSVDATKVKVAEQQLQAEETQRRSLADRLGNNHKDVAEFDRTINMTKQRLAQAKAGVQDGKRQDVKAQQLASVITSTVSPGSWAETGGPGSVKVFNTKLVIATTKSNHESIETLLKLLRDDSAQPAPKP